MFLFVRNSRLEKIRKIHIDLLLSMNKSFKVWFNTCHKSSVNIYLFKVNSRNTRKTCEIWLKLTIKTPEPRHERRSGIFVVNFEHISQFFQRFY